MNSYDIDRAIPMSHASGYVIPTHLHVVLEHRRSCFGEAPGWWVDQWHERQRFSCFCLVWACVGAQMQLSQIASAE